MSFLTALWASPTVRTALPLGLTILVIAIVMRLGRRALRARIQDNALRYRASKLASAFGYGLILIVVATRLAGQFSGLTLALGAASAGIAFALQEVIASFAGWLAIALGGFYDVGDRVQLGGIKGDVIDIGILRTTLMEMGDWVKGDLYNGRVVRVANSFVFKEPVFNYSGDFPFLWDEIVVPIKYGSDYEIARTILMDAAAQVVGAFTAEATEKWAHFVRSYRIENAPLDPIVTLVANDNWVELTLRYVVDHRARRATKSALFTRVLREVEATRGRVEFASMTVQLVGMPALRVAVSGPDRAEPAPGKIT